jgi:hypothetical protein
MATEEPSLSADEIRNLKEIANALDGNADLDKLAQVTGTSRRDVLKIAAALGIGSIAGGGAASELVGSAAAQADTSDSDGNVGLPGDRVDVFADGVDAAGPVEAPSVSAESLVIGGTLYEEDDNSPFQPSSTSSATYTISGNYDEVIVIPERENVGFDQLRINGQSDGNYDYTTNADSQTSGATEWEFGQTTAWMRMLSVGRTAAFDFAGVNVDWVRSGTALTAYGRYDNGVITSLDSLTFTRSTSGNESMNARVFGRAMDI